MARYRGVENRAYIEAMRELRRSNATTPHVNKARRAKRGLVKGGRSRQHNLREV